MTAATDNPTTSDLPHIAFTAQKPVARAETPEDAGWIAHLHDLAFGPGRFARAAFRVREQFAIDPTLSMVAEIDGKPVSSVWMTPISLSGENGYLLGPLATDPAYRSKGAGKLLVKLGTEAALARNNGDFVLLVGDPPYYMPLGFQPTTKGAITFPGPVDPDRILAVCRDPEQVLRLKGPIAPFRAG